jgi:hypothetical protein
LISDSDKVDLALCLEGQRLFNEISTSTNCIAAFKRISLPLVRRIYPSEVIMGSLKPCKNWYKFETFHIPLSTQFDDNVYNNIDREAESLAIIAEKVVEEIKDRFGKVKMHCFRYNNDDGTLEMNYDLI